MPKMPQAMLLVLCQKRFNCDNNLKKCDWNGRRLSTQCSLISAWNLKSEIGRWIVLQQWSCVVSAIVQALVLHCRLRSPSGSWCNRRSLTYYEMSSGIRLQRRHQTSSFLPSLCEYSYTGLTKIMWRRKRPKGRKCRTGQYRT